MMEIIYVPLGELQRWKRNPKQHNTEAMAASIERWGFTQPLLIDDATGRLVAGHGRLAALIQRRSTGGACPEGLQVAPTGDWLVPTTRRTFANEEEAEAYLLADNQITIEHARALSIPTLRQGHGGFSLRQTSCVNFQFGVAYLGALPMISPAPRYSTVKPDTTKPVQLKLI